MPRAIEICTVVVSHVHHTRALIRALRCTLGLLRHGIEPHALQRQVEDARVGFPHLLDLAVHDGLEVVRVA